MSNERPGVALKGHCEARRADDSVASRPGESPSETGEWQSGEAACRLCREKQVPPHQIATLVLSPVEGSATPPRNDYFNGFQ